MMGFLLLCLSVCNPDLVCQGGQSRDTQLVISHFTNINDKQTLELFEKFVTPILNYGAEVLGF